MLAADQNTLALPVAKWSRRAPKVKDSREEATRMKAMARDRRRRLEEIRNQEEDDLMDD